ncbi:hypothetical protein BH24BAC1_BH24BAC1_20390 [soil metagenome]
MSRYLLLPLIFLLPSLRLQAQHLMGLAGSNRAGSHAAYLNPSAIADSRQGFHLNLFTGYLNFTNTYFHYTGPGMELSSVAESIMEADLEDLEEEGEIFEREFARERLDGKPKMAHLGMEFRLPSFMLKLSPRHSIALNTRFRTALQANNVSEDLARVIGFCTANPALQNTSFIDREAYFNINAFAETGLTYARVLLSREKRFLKGGITVKRMAGLYSAHLLAPEVDYQLRQNQDGESYIQVQQGNAQFGFSRSNFDIEGEEVLEALTWRNIPGSGWGLDLGFTYEHRPSFGDYQYQLNGEEKTDQGENKYKFRIGASLLDVGGITYNNPQEVRRYDITRQNLDLTGDTFGDVDIENLGPTLEDALAVQPSERETTIRSGLPTALHLNFDYRLTRSLFLNAALLQGLRGKDAVAMRQYSVLTLAPRLETKSLELAFPVSLMNDYRDLALGAMLRLGPLLVGSHNLLAFSKSSKAVGPDLYLGLGFGFGTGGQKKKLEEREQKKAKRASKAAEQKK